MRGKWDGKGWDKGRAVRGRARWDHKGWDIRLRLMSRQGYVRGVWARVQLHGIELYPRLSTVGHCPH